MEIQKKLISSETIRKAIEATKQGRKVYIRGLAGSLKALFLAQLSESLSKPVVFITGDDEEEEIVRQDLIVLNGEDNVVYFPQIREFAEGDSLFDSYTKNQLLSGFEKIFKNQRTICIIAARNIIHKLPHKKEFIKQSLNLKINQRYDFEFLKQRLFELGFEREPLVENWGEMSVRGGIIDVYPFSADNPCRIEMLGDTIESIRVFDTTTQRSINQVAQLIIYPQFPEDVDKFDNSPDSDFFDYFHDQSIIFIDELELIEKKIEEFFQFRQSPSLPVASDRSREKREYLNWQEIEQRLDGFKTINHSSYLDKRRFSGIDFKCQPQESLRGNFKLLKRKLDHYLSSGSLAHPKVFFLCDNQDQMERLQDIFIEEELDLSRIQFMVMGLNQGFVFPESGLIVFTDNQFYGRPIRWRSKRKFRRGLSLQQLNSLTEGDFVVHVDKGIGVYRGLKKITVKGHERECLKIEYRDADLLYVPLERMDRIQKYSAKEGVVPTISKLGGKAWERLKNSTKKRIKEIARELTLLYASRKFQPGFAFSKDSLWQKELEASFEYEETPDQRKAAEEIKQDMEKNFPMDRLVCGDVGYGKTEVAVRAAFKAVNDNKQVAVLVPTTILALQHYNLFRDRISKFPVKVEMLSRFRTKSIQRRIIEKLAQGKVDVVIGTHRLLSRDVKFNNLGLLVIDEEHRFGVRKKENIKKKYLNVDVLSMSATPIPRTLNMALLGIRDMSLITTPPRDRKSIHTEIAQFNTDIIRMAILKEVERGGQIFFVHNRVQSIESMTNLIRRVVPEVSVIYAHGQMDERELEKVMWDFATQKYQCLVSTMIIESGLDIPNVNTMIINRADKFGLSQLYQLRGRVGRSNQRAYAYLLVPSIKNLNKNALKRLRIIENFSELGSGFSIAMRDLEIRGAGNLLGSEQSGHIVALGYDMYSKIIEEAARELKQEQEGKLPAATEVDEFPRIEINADAYIPDQYMDQPDLKVDIYRRLANAKEVTGVDQLREELKDRFGSPPNQLQNLFNLVEMKLVGKILGFKLIKIDDLEMTCFFVDRISSNDNRELVENKISTIVNRAHGKFRFFQGRNDGFGLKLSLTEATQDPINYCKNFLKKLI
ncbi:MAG TPA: transcription-repair coupling factor [bacterium]|nr:transcription-repair coupling factor [bacterium]